MMRSATLDPCLKITYCHVLSCKNKEARKIFPLISLPPSFSYTRTSTPTTHVRVHARMHVRTKSFCFDSVPPASLYNYKLQMFQTSGQGSISFANEIYDLYIKKKIVIRCYYKFPSTYRVKMIHSLRTHSVDFSFAK